MKPGAAESDNGLRRTDDRLERVDARQHGKRVGAYPAATRRGQLDAAAEQIGGDGELEFVVAHHLERHGLPADPQRLEPEKIPTGELHLIPRLGRQFLRLGQARRQEKGCLACEIAEHTEQLDRAGPGIRRHGDAELRRRRGVECRRLHAAELHRRGAVEVAAVQFHLRASDACARLEVGDVRAVANDSQLVGGRAGTECVLHHQLAGRGVERQLDAELRRRGDSEAHGHSAEQHACRSGEVCAAHRHPLGRRGEQRVERLDHRRASQGERRATSPKAEWVGDFYETARRVGGNREVELLRRRRALYRRPGRADLHGDDLAEIHAAQCHFHPGRGEWRRHACDHRCAGDGEKVLGDRLTKRRGDGDFSAGGGRDGGLELCVGHDGEAGPHVAKPNGGDRLEIDAANDNRVTRRSHPRVEAIDDRLRSGDNERLTACARLGVRDSDRAIGGTRRHDCTNLSRSRNAEIGRLTAEPHRLDSSKVFSLDSHDRPLPTARRMKAGNAWRDSKWHLHRDLAKRRDERWIGCGGGVRDGGVKLEHLRPALTVDDGNRLPVGQCITELHGTY